MSSLQKSLSALSIVLIFASCSEIPPFINYGPDIVLAKDTTYVVSDIPAPEDKNVLIEDVSGTRCSNCPAAAKGAHDFQKDNPGRVVVVTLHPTSIRQFTTPHEGVTDTLNTDISENIMQSILGVPTGLPAGAVDRKIFDSESSIIINPAKWAAKATEQLALKSKVNLEVEMDITEEERKARLDVKTTFVADESEPVYLSILMLESHIVQTQSIPGGKDKDYEHNHVLRYGHTNFSGLKLADEMEKGRVFEKSFDLEIPEKFVFENMTAAIIVHYLDGSKEVLQCADLEFNN